MEVQYHPDFVFPAPENASAEFTRVIRKMCSYSAEDRYQSMAEVLMDVLAIWESREEEKTEEFLEFLDMVTETYRDEKEETEENTGYEERPMTRAERKVEMEVLDELYFEGSVKTFLFLMVLLTFLFLGFQKDISMVNHWMFWSIPLAVFVEAILLMTKEFHIFAACAVLVLAYFCIDSIGVTLPHIILILGVLSGRAVLSMTAAVSTGLWMYLAVGRKFMLPDFFDRFHLKWIVAVLVVFAIVQFYKMRYMWKIEPWEEDGDEESRAEEEWDEEEQDKEDSEKKRNRLSF